jgi:two-component sensor histidine kinase
MNITTVCKNPVWGVYCSGYRVAIRAGVCYVLLALLFVCPPVTVSGQYQPVDIPALKRSIALAKTDTAKSRLYGILGWELRFADSKEAEKLADEMIRMASRGKDHRSLAQAYKIKGFLRVLEQKIEECLAMYTRSMEQAKLVNDGYTLAHVTGLIAGMYQDKGDFDRMIQYFLEGLQIAEKYKVDEMIAFLSNCIGEAYSDAGRPVSVTLPYYQRALEIENRIQNWQYVGMIWSNIAKDNMLSGNKREAEKAAEQAISYINRKADRAYVYATVTTDIGEVYLGIGKYREAEGYLLKSLHILDSLGTKDNVLIPLGALSQLYKKTNEAAKANAYAQRLLTLSTAYKSKRYQRDSYEVLSSVAKKSGDPELALKYYELYKLFNDSLFNENREKTIAEAENRVKLIQKELEVKYEAEKKAKENEELKQSNLGLQNRTIAAIIIAGLLLVLGVVLVLTNRVKTRKNRQLEMQKKIIEQQSGEKDTLIREINHRVKNNLQVISSLLNLQAHSLTDPEAIEALRDSHKRVKAISLIHQKLYGFETIAAIPLGEYVGSLFADLKTVYAAIDVELVCVTRPRDLYLDIESAVPVGLILNEVITNALKYAFSNGQSGILSIQVSDDTEKGYTVVVHDNGVGLPAGFDTVQSGSLGFRIIKELTRQLRGQYHYTTGQGTTFTLQFPNSNLRARMSS